MEERSNHVPFSFQKKTTILKIKSLPPTLNIPVLKETRMLTLIWEGWEEGLEKKKGIYSL